MLDNVDVLWLRGVGTSLPGLRGRKGAAEGPWAQLEPGCLGLASLHEGIIGLSATWATWV